MASFTGGSKKRVKKELIFAFKEGEHQGGMQEADLPAVARLLPEYN